jgi:hypothetical protein
VDPASCWSSRAGKQGSDHDDLQEFILSSTSSTVVYRLVVESFSCKAATPSHVVGMNRWCSSINFAADESYVTTCRTWSHIGGPLALMRQAPAVVLQVVLSMVV